MRTIWSLPAEVLRRATSLLCRCLVTKPTRKHHELEDAKEQSQEHNPVVPEVCLLPVSEPQKNVSQAFIQGTVEE